MKTDLQIKADVTAELAWDAACNAAAIGVAVKEGVVTLSGQVDTFLQKRAVDQAVRRVSGVRGVALDLEVRLAPGDHRSDTDIAQAAVAALRWHSVVPQDKVRVEVDDGWVTLTGEVDWPYQRASAEQCIQPLTGVRGVTNQVAIASRAAPGDIQSQIRDALGRHAAREARHIEVAVDGGVVTLTGKVGSLSEHEAAVGTAFAARGVTRVVDRLEVTG
ncbi:MAG TPA: BON domain-containing protein [Ramlibacter sp.]|uniref:BON domain-containing protein n=1 Tax=Ramlibacter sp. TaxID=1917967 RepID=UPI002B8915AE|nr:BON domain-containing protein [Ramlibacter sp.]HVZ42855.1 BON domain-containing protein [Ramlibacter sp.]